MTATGEAPEIDASIGGFAREVLDAVAAFVLVLDTEGRIVEVNEATARLVGRRREELLGRVAWDALQRPPAARSLAASFFERALQQEFPLVHERLLVSPDGTARMIRWCGVALRDGQGRVRHVVATGQDVTEARTASRAEAEQLHLLHTLIDTIPAPIFYKDAQGIYLGCNAAFAEMLGRRREEIVGRTVHESFPPEFAARFEAQDQALFRQPGVQTYEARIRHADGSDRDVVFYKATWESTEGSPFGLVGVMLDITERKHAERALEEAHAALEDRVAARTAELAITRDAAEAADRAKGEFLNIASHELRTPLTLLRLALQRAERELRAGMPIQLAAVERMDRHVRRLVRLATELLEAARLERGTLDLQCAEADLGALLAGVVDDFRALASDRAIELHLPEQPIVAVVDEERLAQVIANLIDNALKYGARGGPVEVTLRSGAGEAVLEVADHGPGIPPEEQGLVFLRYFRQGSGSHLPGLGLGLHISRELVERHGGTIAYEAPEAGGSRFVVRLPIRAPQATAGA